MQHFRDATSPRNSKQRESKQGRGVSGRDLRATFDLAPVGIGHFRPDGRFTLVNDQLCAILGYSRPELLSLSFQDISFPDDLPRCLELNEKLLSGELPRYQLEKRFVRPDGSPIWVRVTVSVVRNGRNQARFFLGIVEDVSAERAAEERRREIEDRLRTSEQQFRSLANAIPQLAWIATQDGRRLWYNDQWYAYTGLAVEQSLEYGWHAVHHPDFVEHVRARQLRAFREGRVWEDTVRLRAADGSYRWFLSRARPVRDDDGRITQWIGTNTDITDRLEAEQHVRRSESRLRRIVESGMIGVFYWRVTREITDANDTFLKMLGFTRDDLKARGINSRDLTPERWHDMDDAKFAEVVATGVALQWEKEFLAADGRAVPVLVAKALLEGSEDEGIAICLDISERKAADRERERLLGLERAARIRAERETHLREEILAVVAHDLRNPASTVAMSAALLQELPLSDEDRARQLAIIRRSAQRMDRLITDLLDVARIESGTLAVRLSPTRVESLMTEVRDTFESLAREKRITLDCHAPVSAPLVAGDHDRLVQVLSNLVGNALKFTPPGGNITVQATSTEDAVCFSVEDTGAGIRTSDLPRVFDRFWQRERATRSGAGLGLAISKALVDAHSGRIWVDSEEGRGSSFHFTIPVAATATAQQPTSKDAH